MASFHDLASVLAEVNIRFEAVERLQQEITESLGRISARVDETSARVQKVEERCDVMGLCVATDDVRLGETHAPAPAPAPCAPCDVDAGDDQPCTSESAQSRDVPPSRAFIVSSGEIVCDIVRLIGALGYRRISMHTHKHTPHFAVGGTYVRVAFAPVYDAICITTVSVAKGVSPLVALYQQLVECPGVTSCYTLHQRMSPRGDMRIDVCPRE